jgi:exodeoxyribonuclease-1
LLQQFQKNIFVHVSGFISSAQGCCSLIMPVCPHPSNNNAVLCIDLLKPIDKFEDNNVESLKQALFVKSTSSGQSGDSRTRTIAPRIYNIAVNKCPFVAPIKTLTIARANELGIDINLATEHYKRLIQLPFLAQLCSDVYTQSTTRTIPTNVDERLYTSDFPSSADTKLMKSVRETTPEQLSVYVKQFESDVLNQLLFRYRARNFPGLLDEQEMKLWQQHVEDRLTRGNKVECLSLDEYLISIDELSHEYQQHPDKMKILQSLRQYAQQISSM